MPAIRIEELEVQVHEWRPLVSRTGPAPVICLPSCGLSGMQWRKLARALAERRHRVLAPDLIGHGDYGQQRQRRFEARHDVAVVNGTIDLCTNERIHLVGHSYGGRIGLAAATMRPERIRSIALFEPTWFGLSHSLEHADEGGVPNVDDDRFAGSEASIGRFINYWSIHAGASAWSSPDNLERLGAIPMLVLSGADSTRAGRRCCEVLAEMMPNCRHVELPAVGHMGPLLASDAVNALLIEHIDGVEAPWTQAD